MRQRLRARPEPAVHPDPDLLTAYIEQALPPVERSQVVQHLADCGYCREIVSLSLPEPQPEQIAAPAAVRSRWWVPAYRWAAVAATLAIAATLVIEKPWKTGSNRVSQPATISVHSQPAASNNVPAGQSAATQPTDTPTPANSVATVTEAPKTPASTGSTLSARRVPRAAGPAFRDDRQARAGAPNLDGAAGGIVSEQRQATAVTPPPLQPVITAQAQRAPAMQNAYAYAPKDAGQDYVNRTLLSNQTVEVSSGEPKLPEAPSPKEAASQDAARAQKITPKITTQNLMASAMDVAVAPPNTAEQPAPSPADSTLAKSGGFRLKSKVHEAIDKTVATVKKATSAKSSESGMAGFVAPSSISSSSLADADHEGEKTAAQGIHWSITPDGRLLRSTDVGQWHQVNPEGPDVRFRVVEPRGSEVWVGGNHGTLIHSWNAGVDWSKLSVPDSTTSDITGISIDGDNVQVKTSNGQTFVSNDHGKTWVPLQQQPQ